MKPFPVQPEANLITDCEIPPEIPKRGSSYRQLEIWAAQTMKVWASCAINKKALVNSWPRNNEEIK